MTGNDPVLPADPLEHHLRRPGLVEAASELLAIVAEYLVRDAEALQRLNKRQHTARPVVVRTTAAMTQNRE
jgi:hypothetical protein